MFLDWLQRGQRTFLIIILVVVVASFIWLYNPADLQRVGAGQFAKIYGRPVSISDYQREARLLGLAQELGLFDFLQGLIGQARTEEEATRAFVWNLKVLRHEADELGVAPTDAQVLDAIRELTVLHDDKGQFDPAKLAKLYEEALTPRGFTEAQLDGLVRDSLKLKKMQQLLKSTVLVSPLEFSLMSQRYTQRMEIETVRFARREFLEQAQVTDDDLAKEYETQKATLLSPEQRVVEYAVISLADAEKSLPAGPERNKALQAKSEKAGELAERSLEAGTDFAKLAAELGAVVNRTAPFSVETPDSSVSSVKKFAPAAFGLTKDEPNGDVFQEGDSFYVLHLLEIQPGKPLTLDEVRPRLTTTLKIRKAGELMDAAAADFQKKAEEKLKAGTDFTALATELGRASAKAPVFSPSALRPDAFPDAGPLSQQAMQTRAGSVSAPVKLPDGGLALIYVRRRSVPEETKIEEQKSQMLDTFAQYRQRMIFSAWLEERKKAADLQML